MATWPSYARVLIATSDTPGSVVATSEMERGIPKVRRIAADAIATVPVEVLFHTEQQAADFEDWFYDVDGANGGAAWFDWVNPRTKSVVEAQIVNGEIGSLVPIRQGYAMSSRSMQLRYVRSTYP